MFSFKEKQYLKNKPNGTFLLICLDLIRVKKGGDVERAIRSSSHRAYTDAQVHIYLFNRMNENWTASCNTRRIGVYTHQAQRSSRRWCLAHFSLLPQNYGNRRVILTNRARHNGSFSSFFSLSSTRFCFLPSEKKITYNTRSRLVSRKALKTRPRCKLALAKGGDNDLLSNIYPPPPFSRFCRTAAERESEAALE